MYSEIVKTIVTWAEVSDALEALDAIEAILYKTRVDDQQSNGIAAKYKLVKELQSELADQADKVDWIRLRREELKNMRVVRLTTAIELASDVVDRAGSWVKQNIGLDTVIDWVVDARLLGGCKVTFEGKFTDQSLATRLDEYWEKYDR